MELLDQPEIKIVYTLILERLNKKIIVRFISETILVQKKGTENQVIKLSIRLRYGVTINNFKLDWLGKINSFDNSFSASAKGWNTP